MTDAEWEAIQKAAALSEVSASDRKLETGGRGRTRPIRLDSPHARRGGRRASYGVSHDTGPE
jgi:hypothetical protein